MSSFRQDAIDVINLFGSLGVKVDQSSRVGRMVQVLKSRDYLDPKDSDFNIALEALRDIQQLKFALVQIDINKAKEDIKPLLRKILSDPTLPQNSGQHTQGRDSQAELFVFAACRKAGFNPSWEEPDIVCSVDHKEIKIAVKRVKNIRQLVKRVREGANQIEKVRSNGVVIVDVVVAMNPNNYRTIAKVPNVAFGRGWLCLLKKTVNYYHGELQKAIKNKGVLAIILHDHRVHMDSASNWKLETMTYRIPAAEIESSFSSCLEEFTERYRSVFPNPTQLTK